MKLATLVNDTLDGQLIVVSSDGTCAVAATEIAPSMLAALQSWSRSEPLLRALAVRLDNDTVAGAFAFDATRCAAPLPRSPQWCDGSAFLNHGSLMQVAFNTKPIPDIDKIPLMYQGASDDFLGPHDDVPMADVALGSISR
jgi:fumarylacetoacetate (FAA) hydrolase